MDILEAWTIDPEEDDSNEISELILQLENDLSYDIVLQNIQEDFQKKDDFSFPRVNYVEYFTKKYDALTKTDIVYDNETLYNVVGKLAEVLLPLFEENYYVRISQDYEYSSAREYLELMETIYEFFFVRQQENISDYFIYKIQREKEHFIYKYQPLLNKEPFAKDLFVSTQKKKFKNISDVIIIHFLNDIIEDIIEETESLYVFSDEVVQLDLYEVYNNRMRDYLITYGNSLTFVDDMDGIKKYFEPILPSDGRIQLRNNILMGLLKNIEIIDIDERGDSESDDDLENLGSEL